MKKQDFITRINEIGTCEDMAQVRQLLAELSPEVESDYDSIATLTDEVTQLKEDNESLRGYNMKLFLQVSEKKTPEDIKKSNTGIDEVETPDLKYDDLFNEKGELK